MQQICKPITINTKIPTRSLTHTCFPSSLQTSMHRHPYRELSNILDATIFTTPHTYPTHTHIWLTISKEKIDIDVRTDWTNIMVDISIIGCTTMILQACL
ncbi:hypothetical protein GOP47_0002200 [Adiantum capillus-veneris]|uniref:Uncharacterized protein n=1 Tax=Adiantum capillus-veneris TaxID=13818 RepID=A0A9D4VAA0_ADICA|nr:hypothetical protein GOP47_0002200 [Adiantum capillus-veneris]